MLFSHRSESPEPHTAESPAWGALASGRGALRAFNFEGQQGLIAGAPAGLRNRDFALKGHTQNLLQQQDPGKKQSSNRSLGQPYLLVLESLLEKQKRGFTPGSPWGQGLGQPYSGAGPPRHQCGGGGTRGTLPPVL